MTQIRLGPEALRASRFALSPLAETFSRLVVLRREQDGGRPGAQARALAGWLADDPFAAGLVRLISATKYLPDFVAIPPTSMTTRIEDELAEMRALLPDAAARATIAESGRYAWKTNDLQWADVDGVTTRAAAVFARIWEWFVEPDWPRRRAVMERDIRHRAGVLATRGWRDALSGMGKIRWAAPDAIFFSLQTYADLNVGEHGLVLVPHTGTVGQWMCEAPPRLALVYPARGALAEVRAATGGVARLIGGGRARVLGALADASTPSQLAALLGVSLGTVSGHLAALRDAGVVVGRRSGRAVYYERTPLGDDLAATL
ncbi:ArsR family transcriptional regulator [Actinoplanes sp. SE50]|uniref:ArsR/SmtB family transcription factor n=1 Tax=unclassified Actinoplanes TaxID=2626549 RepID=UPI00023EC6FB|nr:MULTISPECIES: winged helix-turn-helix domain-containing protein [unclassified Actinoplanes]AEV81437.1 putative transcriptional regulator, ArsR family [Actinoplanes sp. SE50/110]ATO79840.1 ArsR family transcriptional regulator [Actinoplanes sp. SE50]SLL97242.1 transcriptional regulator [Actinoplanes sp. SE50/110]